MPFNRNSFHEAHWWHSLPISPSIWHELMRPDTMILVLWMLSFKPAFSLSSFTFIKRLLSYSLLSAIKVVSSAYLRLLIFLLAILIPACDSTNPAFHMMYSTYRLNKQSDNIQPWCTPFQILNQFIVPCPVLPIASWPAYRFLRRQVRWSGIPISWRIFQFVVIHMIKGFSQWSRSRSFSGIPLLFLWSNGCWQFDLWFLCFQWYWSKWNKIIRHCLADGQISRQQRRH